MAPPGLGKMLEHFWHPVCTASDLEGRVQPLPVRLLGRSLVVARLPDEEDPDDEYEHGLVALDDRCLHRSTPLSLGSIEHGGVRCAHHGWLWAGDGSCRDVPGQPVDALPRRARVGAHAVAEAHSLIWVKLDDSASVEVPQPAASPGRNGSPSNGVAPGSVHGQTPEATMGALRRVEHLLDRAVGTWSSPAASRQAHPQRRGGLLSVDVPAAPLPFGLAGATRTVIRVYLPAAIEIQVTDDRGSARTFWGASVPIDHGVSRWCWSLSGDGVTTADHADVSELLVEHEQLEASKVPPELSLDRLGELSSRQDRISMAYRRGLEDLLEASRRGPQLLVAALRVAVA